MMQRYHMYSLRFPHHRTLSHTIYALWVCSSQTIKAPRHSQEMHSNLEIWILSRPGGFMGKAQITTQHKQRSSNRLYWSLLKELFFLSRSEPLSGAATCQAAPWDKYSERNKSGTPMEKTGAQNNWRLFVKMWLHYMICKHQKPVVSISWWLHAWPPNFLLIQRGPFLMLTFRYAKI